MMSWLMGLLLIFGGPLSSVLPNMLSSEADKVHAATLQYRMNATCRVALCRHVQRHHGVNQ